MTTEQQTQRDPFIWLQDNELDGVADCGCAMYLDREDDVSPSFFQCPLHAAAPGLLAALQALSDELEAMARDLENGEADYVAGQWIPNLMGNLQSAIRKATGDYYWTAEPKMTDRMYKGQLIRECCWATGEHAGKWIIQTYHQTGMQWSDEYCPHYWTLTDARAAINESILAN